MLIITHRMSEPIVEVFLIIYFNFFQKYLKLRRKFRECYFMLREGYTVLYRLENVARATHIFICHIHEESSNVNLFKFLIFSGLVQVVANMEHTRFTKASN